MTSVTPGERISRTAAVDLSDKRYHLVKLDANEEVVLATAATDAIIGVLDNEPKAGHTADIVLINGVGTFKVKAAAVIAKDDTLTTNGAGRATPTTTEGNRVFGRAMRAGVIGEIVEYLKINEKV